MTKRRPPSGNRKGKPGAPVARPPLQWRRIGRWSLALLLFAVMASGAAWGVARLTDPSVLPLKVVRIDGRLQHLNRGDIENAVGRAVQGNFFTLDVSAVRRAATSLPWIEQVSVRRVWPETLQMQVQERVPLARWGQRGLVTGEGVTFTPAKREIPAGLPMLAGPRGSAAEVVGRYRQMQLQLQPLGLTIASLRLDARQAWQITTSDGLQLQLGSGDLDRRLARLVRVYPRLQQAGRRALTIDLRYTNGLAVRWQELDTDEQQQSQSSGQQRNGRGRV